MFRRFSIRSAFAGAMIGLLLTAFQNCAQPNQISPLDSSSVQSPFQGFVLATSINANVTNYDLQAAAVAAGWDSLQPVKIDLTISPGVVIDSSSVLTPAFVVEAFPAGSRITIDNQGSILGTRNPSKADKTLNQAWEGGSALEADFPITLKNSGQIIGGSGSGGQGEGDSCGGCGGGNGGSNGGAGGPAIICNADLTITNTGGIYGAGGGGSGGGGAYAAGVGSGAGGNGQGAYLAAVYAAESGSSGVSNGGNGGTFGQAGLNGGNAGNGQGYGGPGGYSFVLNGHSVELNGQVVVANSSYVESTWLSGTKGRVAP